MYVKPILILALIFAVTVRNDVCTFPTSASCVLATASVERYETEASAREYESLNGAEDIPESYDDSNPDSEPVLPGTNEPCTVDLELDSEFEKIWNVDSQLLNLESVIQRSSLDAGRFHFNSVTVQPPLPSLRI